MDEGNRPIYIQTLNLTFLESSIEQMNVIQHAENEKDKEAEGLAEADTTTQRISRQSSSKIHPPEGLEKITDGIYMDKHSPLRKGTNVYKGQKLFAGEWGEVAIKLIPYAEQNFKEAKLLMCLGNHQNIVRIHDANEYHQGLISYIYIVMELCQQTLKDYIDENKGKLLDFEKAFSYAEQIVSGIAHIHQNNILHRDIKLENILISSEGRIRVADFGLSKQLSKGASASSVSSPGLGTEGYRAPEMLHDNPKASFYSDAFSLAIVLCQLFSNGHHPFGSDRNRWRTNILDNKGKDLSQICQFPVCYDKKRAEFCNLIDRSLNFNPRKRPIPQEMLQLPFFASKIPDDRSKAGDQKERIIDLEKRLSGPLREIGFSKAFGMLKELRDLRGEDDLDTLLKLTECELRLNKGKKWMKEVKRFLSGSTAEQVAKMGEKQRDKKPVQASILLRLSIDFYAEEGNSADDRLELIKKRVAGVCFVLGRWARDVAATLFKEMLLEMRSVEGASEKVQVGNEVSCLDNISWFFELPEQIQVLEEEVTSLKERFGGNVRKCRLFGYLLWLLGDAYRRSLRYEKAKKCFGEAREVYEEADYDEEWKRKFDVDTVKRLL